MSEEQKKADEDMEEEEEGINLLDYLIVLAKRKNLILKITLPVAIITFIIGLFFKASFYEAETSILPPQEENTSIANQFLRDFGVLPARQGNIYNQRELLVEIIKSRTFTDILIEKFKLKEHYGVKNSEAARNRFFKNITIKPDFTDRSIVSSLKEGPQTPLMRISVRDQNAERAATIANAIVTELKSFINNFAITEASKRRLFFEEQLKHARETLNKSEDAIKIFQEKTGLLKIDTQTTLIIEKIAGLQAQITAKEVELQVMRSYSTGSNPDVQKVEETIKVLKNELAKLETNKSYDNKLVIPKSNLPSLGLDYQRKFRELTFNQTLNDILVKQYESAKIDESKNSFMIQVIDKAVPPQQKNTIRMFGLKKALTTTIFAFFFACFLAFFMEYREKSVKNERLETLMGYLSFRKKG